MLYGSILAAIKDYQKKLGLELKGSFVVSDAPVWKCLLKNGVKGIYSRLVRNRDIPKCLNKWSKELNIETDVKEILNIIFKTTNDSCLRWFQYKLLHGLFPTGHFLYLRKLLDSTRCILCNHADETILDMFWDCPKIQDYWLAVQNWICPYFTHCNNVIFTRDLIILGSEKNTITDRFLDLLIFMGKYHIFTAKPQGNVPYVNAFIMKIKHRFLAEIYYYIANNLYSKFTSKWLPYYSRFA